MENFNTLSVKQLNFYVRSLIEGDIRLNNICVSGELSNFKNHYQSGHWYFTLKDNDAAIKCVMFRANAQKVLFEAKDGMQVVLKGRVSFYEKDGQYQFYAEEMHTDGFGDIALKFEQIKERLQKEGMFSEESKRPLPKYPKKIAVVTSPTGAAIQDILNILGRRWPMSQIIVCPVSVQGELAVPSMCNALDKLYRLAIADVIIIGRGGGSIEDLWAFNDEILARKIYESPVPVISAVGHETDFTICDFVADLRAPTPSAAAELAVPDISEIKAKLNKYNATLRSLLKSNFSLNKARLEKAENCIFFKNPKNHIINERYEKLDKVSDMLLDIEKDFIIKKQTNFNELVLKLDALSPLKTLIRGYTAVSKNSAPVKSVNDTDIGDRLKLSFSDG
ncbi:MAG: exodeoxyribonuclease VII large subunit, partial [Clostridia bacterium]|nr:exodeoxyribonuclease VII large subunit [Clostridia bacterium]